MALLAGLDLQAFAIRAALIVAAFGIGWVGGCTDERGAWEVKQAASAGAASAIESKWQRELEKQRQESSDEKVAITAERDALIDRMRSRPARMSEPARSACKGSTGQELARDDGEFLAREAAEAAQQQAALKECYAWVDMVTAR